ncbi:N-acetyltransferase [Caulobacter segnis]|uniref:N-acetyltransferase n=1 Tax=Caulobacter segnis TaxID=88688 RepID=UPI001CBF8D63|nr:N-acetyltransferase [Caulobacter segnis]UAL10210.1 N-acetyltransferase [Caulobacter segnis]
MAMQLVWDNPRTQYRLRHTTEQDVHRAELIKRFAKKHGNGEVFERTVEETREHIRNGETVLLFQLKGGREKLVGVAFGTLSHHDDPVLEIAHTIVIPELRGKAMAKVLAAGALMSQAINHDYFSAIMFTCDPANEACLSAGAKATNLLKPASEFLGHLTELNDIIGRRMLSYDEHPDWGDEPMMGMIWREFIKEAAEMWLQMAEPEGLVWCDDTAVIFLDGRWYCPEDDPERTAVKPQVRLLARGGLPKVLIWRLIEDDWRELGRLRA